MTGQFKKFEDIPEGDFRRVNPRFEGDNFNKNLRLVDEIEKIASLKGVRPGQVALAWVLAQGDDIVPIPGTKRVKYLEENAAAVDIALTSDELLLLDRAAPLGVAAGERYAAPQMANLNA